VEVSPSPGQTIPLLFQAGLEVRISRYTIRLLESQLLLVIKLLKRCGNMLRIRKRLVRRGKFLR
jgi:hypothetical protein